MATERHKHGHGPKQPRAVTPAAAVSFDDIVASNTGQAVPTQAWQSGKQRNRTLAAQTERIANALESSGRCPRYTRRDKPVLLGEVTGTITTTHAYRAIRFLPEIAQRDRAPMARALQLFIAEHPKGVHVRFAVFTAGPRLPFGAPLREVICAFHRKLSRWASDARKFDIEVLFRGTEFTVDRAGTVHVHANVLYLPRHKLSSDDWEAFLHMTHQRMGAHWHDNGPLRGADEAIKYSFKPAEIDRLAPAYLCWLHDEIERLKLIQPMGIFQGFCRTLEVRREKVGRITRTPGKPAQLVRVKKQGRGPRPKGNGLRPDGAENEILGRTPPIALNTPWPEPQTVVRNYTKEPKTAGGKLRLRAIEGRQAQAREAWDANGAPPPKEAIAIGRHHDPKGSLPNSPTEHPTAAPKASSLDRTC